MTALVIGLGGIGQVIAELEITEGFRVFSIDAEPAPPGLPVADHIQMELPLIRDLPFSLPRGIERVYITVGRPGGRSLVRGNSIYDEGMVDNNLLAVSSILRAHRQFSSGAKSYVLTSSIDAPGDRMGGAMYNAAKAGVESLTRSLAREWAPTRVNAIAPGPTATQQFLDNVKGEDLERQAARSPAGRLVKPREVARAAYWLARMTGVSGVVLPVDLAAT